MQPARRCGTPRQKSGGRENPVQAPQTTGADATPVTGPEPEHLLARGPAQLLARGPEPPGWCEAHGDAAGPAAWHTPSEEWRLQLLLRHDRSHCSHPIQPGLLVRGTAWPHFHNPVKYVWSLHDRDEQNAAAPSPSSEVKPTLSKQHSTKIQTLSNTRSTAWPCSRFSQQGV